MPLDYSRYHNSRRGSSALFVVVSCCVIMAAQFLAQNTVHAQETACQALERAAGELSTLNKIVAAMHDPQTNLVRGKISFRPIFQNNAKNTIFVKPLENLKMTEAAAQLITPPTTKVMMMQGTKKTDPALAYAACRVEEPAAGKDDFLFFVRDIKKATGMPDSTMALTPIPWSESLRGYIAMVKDCKDCFAKPEVVIKPNTLQPIKLGGAITLECLGMATPRALLQWRFNGAPLDVEKSSSGENAAKLTLKLSSIKKAQFGSYECTATNAIGTNSDKFNVQELITTTTVAPTTHAQSKAPPKKMTSKTKKATTKSKKATQAGVDSNVKTTGNQKNTRKSSSNQKNTPIVKVLVGAMGRISKTQEQTLSTKLLKKFTVIGVILMLSGCLIVIVAIIVSCKCMQQQNRPKKNTLLVDTYRLGENNNEKEPAIVSY